MNEERDPFGPDLSQPGRRIFCMHCGGGFFMEQMVHEVRFGSLLWWCPNPECHGAGLGFDLHPVPWWNDSVSDALRCH
jgi:hypothetical protein